MRIERGPDPGPFGHHRQYKPSLRVVFRSRCAYCLMHDDKLGGEDGATVDHFKPVGRYPELRLVWSNLYYACTVCNCHYKKHYPTPEEEAQGKRFIDPCAEDTDEHFRMIPDERTGDLNRIRPLTAPAEYSVFRLKLNDRKLLRDYWRMIQECERELVTQIGEIQNQLLVCEELVIRQDLSQGASLRAYFESQLETCIQNLREVRSRRPFPMEVLQNIHDDSSRSMGKSGP